jgi:hypothetical protein
MARRRSGKVPVIIAVVAVSNGVNYVEVFAFEPHGTVWVREGQPLRFNQEVDSISIGSQGPKILLAVGLRVVNRAFLYMQDENIFWKMTFNMTGSSVGILGDGGTLVATSTDPPP